MSTPLRIWIVLLTAALLSSLESSSYAQRNYSTSSSQVVPVGASNLPRMRVIENSLQEAVLPTYSVVGAVMNSGVYTTSDRAISVGRLIQAAGGLAPQALPSLRIIRNREVRFQVQYSPDHQGAENMILPGDIVVVPSRPADGNSVAGTSRVVPVACLGLIEHPVVLPLDPSISTVEELVRRLAQHPQVARSAVIIDPLRGNANSTIMCGSVIIFESRYIDQVPLRQPSFLPPVLELDPARTSAIPAGVPTIAETPPAAPPASIVQQVSADMVMPPVRNQPSVPPMALAGTAFPPLLVDENPLPPVSRERQPEQGDQVVPRAAPMLATPAIASSQSTLPPNLAQALDLFAAPSTSTIQQTAVPAANAPAVKPAASASTPGFPETSPIADSHVAPASHSANQSARETDSANQNASQPEMLTESVTSVSKPIQSSRIVRVLLYIAAGISVAVGSGLLLSLVFQPGAAQQAVSPTFPAQPTVISQPVVSKTPSTAQVTPTALNQTTEARLEAVTRPVVAASARIDAVSSQISVKELLDGTVPLVEERVLIPNHWPLHGLVVGHQRLRLNAAHSSLPAPHFAKPEANVAAPVREAVLQSASTAAERALRSNLRGLCRPLTTDPNSIPGSDPREPSDSECDINTGSLPVGKQVGKQTESLFPSLNELQKNPPDNPSSGPESGSTIPIEPRQPAPGHVVFDIVQPQSPAQVSAMSPLERALRTLASEKRG